MERLQREFPEAHLVKAFNSVGNARMIDPQFAGGRPTMFICGNDERARGIVAELLDQLGWETADMGKAEAARAIGLTFGGTMTVFQRQKPVMR